MVPGARVTGRQYYLQGSVAQNKPVISAPYTITSWTNIRNGCNSALGNKCKAYDYGCGVAGSPSAPKSCIATNIDVDTICTNPDFCPNLITNAHHNTNNPSAWCDDVFGNTCLGEDCWNLGCEVSNSIGAATGSPGTGCCGDDTSEWFRYCIITDQSPGVGSCPATGTASPNDP